MVKGTKGAAYRQLELLWRAGSTAALSDGQLLFRVVSRDRMAAAVAFEALVHRHGPMVLATCRGVLRDEHDAEDAFQATFLVLARRAGSLRRGDRLGPWLYRVALRASGRARAASARRRDCEARAAERSAVDEPRCEHAMEREELRMVVHQEVDRLPERYRVVVVLCELQGETYEAAATRLRVPVGTIRSRLSRAREQLRVGIARRGLALPAGIAALAAGEASAAVPAHLVHATLKLANLAQAGGFAAAPAGMAALGYAQDVLRTGGLVLLGKVSVAVAVLGFGLAGASAGAFIRRGRPAASPVAALASIPAAGTAVAPSRSEPERDIERLQGRWVILEARQRGVPIDEVIGDRLVIEGSRFIWTAIRGEPERIYSRGVTRGRVALDPSTDPSRLDLVEPGRTVGGIYLASDDGNRLTLCLGDPDVPGRPRSFASDPNSRQLLLVLRREDASRPRGEPADTGGNPSRKE